jgi:hypothetical protein
MKSFKTGAPSFTPGDRFSQAFARQVPNQGQAQGLGMGQGMGQQRFANSFAFADNPVFKNLSPGLQQYFSNRQENPMGNYLQQHMANRDAMRQRALQNRNADAAKAVAAATALRNRPVAPPQPQVQWVNEPTGGM